MRTVPPGKTTTTMQTIEKPYDCFSNLAQFQVIPKVWRSKYSLFITSMMNFVGVWADRMGGTKICSNGFGSLFLRRINTPTDYTKYSCKKIQLKSFIRMILVCYQYVLAHFVNKTCKLYNLYSWFNIIFFLGIFFKVNCTHVNSPNRQ